MKKLRDVEDVLANFFAQGALRVGKKLGPVAVSATVYIRSNKARDFLQNASGDDEASRSARWRTWPEVAWLGPYNSRARNCKAVGAAHAEV
jgi:DhnA family fructose-bisphosphate aldolase class Ia